MKKLVFSFLIFTLLATGCKTYNLHNSNDTDSNQSEARQKNQITPQDFVFKNELYKQKIHIHIIPENKTMDFDGAIKKSNESILLYGFGPFGVILFNLKDDLHGEITYTSNIKELQDKKEFILKLYPIVKKVFQLKFFDKEYLDQKFEFKLDDPIGLVEAHLEKNNMGKVYKITITKNNFFEFTIVNEDINHH